MMRLPAMLTTLVACALLCGCRQVRPGELPPALLLALAGFAAVLLRPLR